MAKGHSRRRTQNIVLGVAMTAMVVAGCGSDELDQRRCVDNSGKVVAESYCSDDEAKKRYYGSSGGFYTYYYGGSGYRVGETVSDGSRTPPRSYSARSGVMMASSRSSSGSVSRGGFGGSAAAHSSSGG